MDKATITYTSYNKFSVSLLPYLPPGKTVLLCLLDEEMGLCENLQKASLLWANTASCYNTQLVVSTLEFNPHLPFPLKRHGYPSLEGYL